MRKRFLKKPEKKQHKFVSILLPELASSYLFAKACHPPPQKYKIVGVVIPALHFKTRAEQNKTVNINGYECIITTLPNSCIKECRINWNELLARIIP